jgi:hypothetical protein
MVLWVVSPRRLATCDEATFVQSQATTTKLQTRGRGSAAESAHTNRLGKLGASSKADWLIV